MAGYDYRCVSAKNTTPSPLLVRVCCPIIHILTLFQTKKCHFSHPFLRPGLLEIMSSLFRLELNSNKKHFLKSISTFHRSLLFLLIWNWDNKFAHTLQSHSSLENLTWLQTKLSKGYSNLFLDQKSAKTLPLWGGGGTYLYGLYKGVAPPSPQINPYYYGLSLLKALTYSHT